jgi:hypothetical protein
MTDYTGLATLVTASGAVLLAFRNGWRTNDTKKVVQDQGTKLQEVHNLVNSQLTEAVGRRDVAEAENVQLRKDAAEG